MAVSRLKPQVVPFEGEQFYIYECVNGVYQLRDSNTHIVVSSSPSLNGISECFRRLLNRYKNYGTYSKAMSNMSEPAIRPRMATRREVEYKKDGAKHSDLVYSIIEEYNNIGTKSLRRSPVVVAKKETVAEPSLVVPRPSLLNRRKSRFQQQ